ncbi:type IV secretory system conjugative DNA transfer family protein [Dermabacteraceae bacterium P13101]
MSQGAGRRDKTPSFASFVYGNLYIFLLLSVLAVFLLWQFAVWVSTDVEFMDFETTMRALFHGKPVAGLPGGGWLTLFVAGLELLVIIGLFVFFFLYRENQRRLQPGKGMASKAQHVSRLSEKVVRLQEKRLWGDVAMPKDTSKVAFEVGRAAYGMFSMEPAFVSQETHVLVIAPTGGGKTYRLLSRAALDAPGALIMTSTRPDILDVIAKERAAKGRIWVFDLLNLSHWPTKMCWDIVAGCEDSQIARARAGAIVKSGKKQISGSAGGGDANTEFFMDNARDVLQCYLHAAAIGGRSVQDILEWAPAFETDTTAQQILRDTPGADKHLGIKLNSLRTGAPETAASIRNTLDQALSSLMISKIANQFNPGVSDADAFDPDEFARSSDTLVIIADDNDPTDITNLAAMMLDETLRACKNAARCEATGRLTPPVRAVLDEVANVAPLPKLPEMLSDLRAYGVQIIAAVQSGAQTRRRWGAEGAQMLIDNCGALLIMGGLKDPKVLKDISDLAGRVEVTELSTQLREYGMHRGNQTMSTREKEILRPEEIAQLRDGYALLVTGRIPPVKLYLPGWTERPDGDELKKAQQESAHTRAASAAASRGKA